MVSSLMQCGVIQVEQGAVFQSNRSQAIRLPKAVALPDDVKRVDIVAVGRARIITPAGEVWDSWFEGAGATSDFMSERDQAASPEREAF
jgi:antitoxin VapB